MVAFEDLLMDQRHFVTRGRDANLPSFLQDLVFERQRLGSKLFKICGIEIENVAGADDKLSVARGHDLGKFRAGGKIKRLNLLAVLGVEHSDRERKISRATTRVARSQVGWTARPIDLINQDTVGGNKENVLVQRPAKIDGAIEGLKFVSLL